MERRGFLMLAFATVGTVAVVSVAQAAPLSQLRIEEAQPRPNADVRPAVTNSEEAAQLQPEEVRWGRRWGWHPRRRSRGRHWRRRW